MATRFACERHGMCEATHTVVRLPTSARYGPPVGAVLKRKIASCASISAPCALPVSPPLEPTTAQVPKSARGGVPVERVSVRASLAHASETSVSLTGGGASRRLRRRAGGNGLR